MAAKNIFGLKSTSAQNILTSSTDRLDWFLGKILFFKHDFLKGKWPRSQQQ